MLFLLRLIRDGIWDQGWVSFGGFDHEGDGQKLSKLAAIAALAAREGFAEEMAGLAPLADQLDATGPVLFGLDPKGNRLRKDSIRADELPQYADSWFTVVTETEMLDRAHRITEKPLKPLLNLHPFLVLGNPGSLALLRGYGFETYSTVFDERYDEEPDPVVASTWSMSRFGRSAR